MRGGAKPFVKLRFLCREAPYGKEWSRHPLALNEYMDLILIHVNCELVFFARFVQSHLATACWDIPADNFRELRSREGIRVRAYYRQSEIFFSRPIVPAVAMTTVAAAVSQYQ